MSSLSLPFTYSHTLHIFPDPFLHSCIFQNEISAWLIKCIADTYDDDRIMHSQKNMYWKNAKNELVKELRDWCWQSTTWGLNERNEQKYFYIHLCWVECVKKQNVICPMFGMLTGKALWLVVVHDRNKLMSVAYIQFLQRLAPPPQQLSTQIPTQPRSIKSSSSRLSKSLLLSSPTTEQPTTPTLHMIQ